MDSIFPIPALKDNYIWCLQRNNRCVVIDPGDAEPVKALLQKNNLTLSAILVTHHHADHTGGIKKLLQYKKVPVYGPAEIPDVNSPINKESILWLEEVGCHFSIISLPGHTLEHVAYYQEGMVFTGDTLFTGGCGRIFEGTVEQMYASLAKLKLLPKDTLIYCGHEYTEANLYFALAVEPNNADIEKRLLETQNFREKGLPTVPASLLVEKKTNPFLRCDQPDVIAAASKQNGSPVTHPKEVLKILRDWKNNFTPS